MKTDMAANTTNLWKVYVSEINRNNQCCVRNGAVLCCAVTVLNIKFTVLELDTFSSKMTVAGSSSETMNHFSMLFNSAVSCYDKITLVTDKWKEYAAFVFYITNKIQLTQCSLLLSAQYVSGGFPVHHQELIKLYVQPWVLSRFPAHTVL
jgi:hypothetical protein